VLIALSVLTLVLPDYTLATKPGTFSTPQLIFVSALSVLLYGASFSPRRTVTAMILSFMRKAYRKTGRARSPHRPGKSAPA
jgi:Ca2+/H+ antiporter